MGFLRDYRNQSRRISIPIQQQVKTGANSIHNGKRARNW